MTEFLLFSDFHAHNFRYGASRQQHGGAYYNSRMLDAYAVLDEIASYATVNCVKAIVFGGDLFHQKQLQHTEVYNLVHDKLTQMVTAGATLYMLPGNHDYADRSGLVHSLSTFKALGIHVLDDFNGNPVALGDTPLFYTPYSDDADVLRRAFDRIEISAAKEKSPVLLSHLGIQGAKVGSDYVLISDRDVCVDDIPHEKFAGCFFGHFHEHQKVCKNGWYIGATHQHNWGDVGSKRGFLHVTIKGNKCEISRIETNAPKFLVLDAGSESWTGWQGEWDVASWTAQHFLRVVNGQGIMLPSDVTEACGNVEIIETSPEASAEVSFSAEKLNPAGAIAAWTKTHADELDVNRLTALGLSLLQEGV
tara:strand:- start:11478 stop:12566 length:1089 start_codon:yes stop_codon:yes gene_type:complete